MADSGMIPQAIGRRVATAALAATAALLAGCSTTHRLAAHPAATTHPTPAAPTPAAGSLPPGPAGGTLVLEPQAGYGLVYRFLSQATHTVQVELYELQDPQAQQVLAADAARGVQVQVLLDQAYHGREVNQAAYSWLAAHGVQVRWANPQEIFHQKIFLVDGTEALIATFNLVSKYNSSSRNLGYFDTNPADLAAISQVFEHDWTGAAPTPAPPGSGDLVWSPGSARPLADLIDQAHTSLDVECEELSDPTIERALVQAAQRGVQVRVVAQRGWGVKPALSRLVAAGAQVATYGPGGSVFIHAKMLVVDNRLLWLGSENFSAASLDYNRELGVQTSSPNDVQQATQMFNSDFAQGTPWGGGSQAHAENPNLADPAGG